VLQKIRVVIFVKRPCETEEITDVLKGIFNPEDVSQSTQHDIVEGLKL